MIFFSVIATYANSMFVIITKNAPIKSDLKIFIFLINKPPIKIPKIDAINATTFTTAPISVRVKPMSK